MKHRQKPNLTIALFLLITLVAIPLSVAAAEGEKTVEYETGFYYTVQKGDTLWDLSQKFSDTPWQWPELWKENKDIANPHRIYPGERIRLYRRSGAQGYGDGDDQQKSTEDTLRLVDLIDFQYAAIERVGFIRKTPVASHGTIFKVEGRMTMISSGDLVYIRPAKDVTLNPGDRFTIYRTLNPIKDRKTNAYVGIQHYLAGAVEITIKRP